MITPKHPTLPAGMPFVEVVDNVKRKGRSLGGYPRPLERVDKDSK